MKINKLYYGLILIILLFIKLFPFLVEMLSGNAQMPFGLVGKILTILIMTLLDYIVVAAIGALVKWLISQISDKVIIPSLIITFSIYLFTFYFLRQINCLV